MHRFNIVIVILLSYLFIPLSCYGPQLEIYALNVGQGDSTLIVTPSKTRILIDGGRDSSVITQLDNVIPFWDRKIDLVMLSHPDADHVTGLIDVLSRFEVSNVAIVPSDSDSSIYKVFKEKISYWGIKPDMFVRGSIVNTTDGVMLKGLWPTSESIQTMSTNENSQVVLLSYGSFYGMFMGDIDAKVSSQLENSHDLLDVAYLKVPHHGSKYNLTAKQLGILSPEISTISVGADNRYGHPSQDTIASLRKVDSKVYRTDINGLITIVVNKSGISVGSE